MTHPDDCRHCGRPENVLPYVIPGTQIELYSSEMDAGRWRHWGGSDMWLCREHRNYVGEAHDENDPKYYRLMEVFEAAEHATLHRHQLIDEARELEGPLRMTALAEFEAVHAARLEALDRSGPNGGHSGPREAASRWSRSSGTTPPAE